MDKQKVFPGETGGKSDPWMRLMQVLRVGLLGGNSGAVRDRFMEHQTQKGCEPERRKKKSALKRGNTRCRTSEKKGGVSYRIMTLLFNILLVGVRRWALLTGGTEGRGGEKKLDP